MVKCPNKASREWKLLVSQVTEDNAWQLWKANKFSYPPAMQSNSQIKKAVGIRKEMSGLQVALMAKRLAAYNKKYNTSHSFKSERVGQADIYNLELSVSYWPKRVMTEVVKSGDYNIIGKEAVKDFINSNPDIYYREGNQYFRDGEIFPTYEDADYLPIGVKEGVSELFESNPELAAIGTLEQYSQYLDTIFPSSKVKDIVYHGSTKEKNIEKFIPNNGIYFTDNYDYALSYAGGEGALPDESYVKTVLINSNNIDNIGEIHHEDVRNYKGTADTLTGYDVDSPYTSYVVFEPEQIHILSSKKDIEGFKEFVSNNPVENEEADYLPAATIIGEEKKVGPKFQTLMDVYNERVKTFKKSIRKLKHQLKTASPEEKNRLINRIETLKKSVDKLVGVADNPDIPGVINEISKLSALEDITKYADSQFNELNNIFAQDNISKEDLEYAENVVNLWLKAGDFSQEDNLFWTTAELYRLATNETLQQVKAKFSTYRNMAESINRRHIIPIEKELVRSKMVDEFNLDAEFKLDNIAEDVSWLKFQTLDASEVNNPVLQLMNYMLKTSTFAAHQEALLIEEKVEELISKVSSLDWELFQQEFSHTDKRKTGNLVFRFSQEYFDTVKEMWKSARKAPAGEAKKDAYNKAIKYMKENTIMFDVRKLFPDKDLWGTTFSQAEVDAHIAELKESLGEYGYEIYYQRAKDKVEKYKEWAEAQREFYETEFGNNYGLVEAAMEVWTHNNSPAKAVEMTGVTKIGDTYIAPTNEFVESVPRKYINGKLTNHYDTKFERIEADSNLRELYNYVFSTLNELKQYLPEEEVGWMQVNSLPALLNTMMEEYAKDKVRAGLTPVWDSLTKSVRMSDVDTVDDRFRNTVTGEVKKKLQTHMLTDYTAEISKLVDLKMREFVAANNTAPSAQQIVEFKRDAADEISKLKTFDLGKVVKSFALMSLGYKHKSSVQDVMKAAEKVISRQIEQQVNKAGADLTDKHGNPLAFKGLTRLKQMSETLMDVYYGYDLDKPFGQTKTTIYTDREKQMKNRYQVLIDKAKADFEAGLITEEVYNATVDILQDQIDVLGGVRTWSKFGDLVLQYVQLKGMGWNVFAGVTNMIYGFVSNITEAADGRNYNTKEFWAAQAKVLHTIGGVNKFSKEAKKIRTLVKNLDVFKDSRYELTKATQKGTLGKISKAAEVLNPYNPQKSTEYINQATVMVAMMLHQKVTLNGETISLYDAYDNNGRLLEGVEFPEGASETKTKIKIDKVIKKNHGNYDPDNPIEAKRQLLGRALSQFRTWAYQGFAERFMDEMYDYQLEMTVKGRYRSYASFYSNRKDAGQGYISSTFWLTKQLLRKATFGKYNTQFSELSGLSEVDAANMRKNMSEIMLYMTMAIFAMLLKASIDDDDPKVKYMAFFWINQLTRLNTDMAFYVSPNQFEKLTRNAMPAFTAVIDAEKALRLSWAFIFDNESDILQSGNDKGESKAWRAIKKTIPNPMNAIDRVEAAAVQDFSDKPIR